MAFQSELSPATGSFTKTQYAAETPGAKVGGSVFVVRCVSIFYKSVSGQLSCNRLTQNVVFPSVQS
jgi:hypothetical protein